MAADANEGRNSFSTVDLGAIHRHRSRTAAKPSKEPSRSSRERLYLPCKAVGNGLPFLDASPLCCCPFALGACSHGVEHVHFDSDGLTRFLNCPQLCADVVTLLFQDLGLVLHCLKSKLQTFNVPGQDRGHARGRGRFMIVSMIVVRRAFSGTFKRSL